MVTVTQEHKEQEDASRFQNEEDKERVTSRVNLTTTPNVDNEEHSGVENGNSVVISTEIDTLDDGSQGCSTLCSDVDDDLEDIDSEEDDGWVTELSVPALQHINNGISHFDPEPPSFGDICVKNSSNVNLGNKTFYKGPVTIKQFVYTNPDFSAINGVIGNGRATSQRDIEASLPTNNDAPVPSTSTDSGNNEQVHRLWTKKYAATALAFALALVLLILVAISAAILSRGSDSTETSNTQTSINRDAVIIDGVRMVGRDEWLAQPPADHMDKLEHPVPYVLISHTASNFCDTQSACTLIVRTAQNFHIESKHWSDIGYNFLTGGDGLAYVGRGWDYVGAHSFGYNNRSIGISFIGTFTNVSPPLTQIRATQKLIEYGVKNKYIAEDYKLLAHRQISPTTSPGDALFNIIKTWPRWAPEP